MLVKRAHHVSLTVSDIEKARAFYGDFLGLEEIQRPDFGFPGAWYAAGGVELHLIASPKDVQQKDPSPYPIGGHTAFEIDDYEAVREVVKARGLEVLETGAEVGQLFVHDPDRNLIELIAPGGRLGRGS
ncbi:MAG: VOC family protein [Myxococcota bacterium]